MSGILLNTPSQEIDQSQLPPLFGFDELEEVVPRDLRDKFGEGGLCWALAVVNALTILNKDNLTKEELEDLQRLTIYKVLEYAANPIDENPSLRTGFLMGEIPAMVDTRGGGFLTKMLFPLPHPAVNEISRGLFGFELIFPTEFAKISYSYPEVLKHTKEGVPYFMHLDVRHNGRDAGGHFIAFYRQGGSLILFEPNADKQIIRDVADPTIERSLYDIGSDKGITTCHLGIGTVPLEVVAVG